MPFFFLATITEHFSHECNKRAGNTSDWHVWALWLATYPRLLDNADTATLAIDVK